MREVVGNMAMTSAAIDKHVEHVMDVLLNGIRKEKADKRERKLK
jgi:hypothetical protein